MNAKQVPVVLLILDGWGVRKNGLGNAIKLAQPACYLHLLETCPFRTLDASGLAVGLPEGQMGNSEVGHLNMGAGRVVYQDFTRINKSIEDGDFYENPVFLEAMAHTKKNNGTLHLMGLVSDGGVHSALTHLLSLIDMAKVQEVPNLRVHAFLDGRDVPPKSAEKYLLAVEEMLLDVDYPQISTICGRYYAMDRDKRWDRVQLAYDNLTLANGRKHLFSQNALEMSYREDVTDEFIKPCVTEITFQGIQDGDAVLFFNFRPDRARELTQAFTDPEFNVFERQKVVKDLYFGCLGLYDERFRLPVAYQKKPMNQLLAEVISQAGIRQLHTAETEKYAHVTFFFNGGIEMPFPGEDRVLIPSPHVATYDLQPEMSVYPVAEEVVKAIHCGEYGFIVCNFANPDMVGHTGMLAAAIQAVKDVDAALERVVEAVLEANGVLLLTADHGNVETMIDEHGGPHTAHTTELVPCVLVSKNKNLGLAQQGHFGLSSIAPTVLELLGLPVPPEMTAPTLLSITTVPVF